MKKIFVLKKSNLLNKKYVAFEVNKNETRISPFIHFGAKGYSDYTKHHSNKRREAYISRHSVNEDWNDLYKSGTWAVFILWNKKTISEAINYMEKKFNIIIIRKR